MWIGPTLSQQGSEKTLDPLSFEIAGLVFGS